jgi:hypothetical protein
MCVQKVPQNLFRRSNTAMDPINIGFMYVCWWLNFLNELDYGLLGVEENFVKNEYQHVPVHKLHPCRKAWFFLLFAAYSLYGVLVNCESNWEKGRSKREFNGSDSGKNL